MDAGEKEGGGKTRGGVEAEFLEGAFNFRVRNGEEGEEESIKASRDCWERVELLEEEEEEEEEEWSKNKKEVFSEKVVLTSSNEKSKKCGSKRAPKPPLPPKGPLLDASDRRLLRELAEIAVRKRERIARLKALKRMRAAAAASKGSSSSSSKGNISAMIITFIFFLLMILHGLGSRDNGIDKFEGSPMQAQKNFLSVHHYHPHGVSSPEIGDGEKRERRQRHRKIW